MCDCNISTELNLKCDSVLSTPFSTTCVHQKIPNKLWEQIQQVSQSSYLGKAWILVEDDLCGYIIVADFALWVQIFHVLG